MMDKVTADLIFVGFGLGGLIFFMSLFGGSSCAGRDACGNKFCITGLFEDYKIVGVIVASLMILAGALLLAANIIGGNVF